MNKKSTKSTNKITLNYFYTPSFGYTQINTPTIYSKKFNTTHEALEFIEFHPQPNKSISSIKYQFNSQSEGGWVTHFLY